MCSSQKKQLLASILVLSLVVTLMLSAAACEDLGLSGETAEETTATDATAISTTDEAIIAVYQRLLERAQSYDAKIYLSDFYTTCDNWIVQSEYFKDGSDIWLVEVDTTAETGWEHHTYWQRAGWFVLNDGTVIPSHLFQVNALRIEADLQALSATPTAE